jgi:phospholipase C
MRVPRSFTPAGFSVLLAVAVALGLILTANDGAPARATPIRHVVIIYQENHSFDNVLGYWCAKHPARHCDGATSGKTSSGAIVRLSHAPDVVTSEGHSTIDQRRAIDGGHMDGFDRIGHCGDLSCYSQYHPAQDTPTLLRLAKRFVISDRTFSMSSVPSWGAHLELAASTMDGFIGSQPLAKHGYPAKPGWGCDSNKFALWRNPNGGGVTKQPSCVPFKGGTGTVLTHSPVRHVPTIMDRLNEAGLTWRLYASSKPVSGKLTNVPYGWAICPSFADCIRTRQRRRMVDSARVIRDARGGHLPSFSVVLPNDVNSQHNLFSMMRGDDWIGRVVRSIMNGPDWFSTAIFITYDDCGCFYDHVAPPGGLGIRVPMVIVSPYARPQFTDRRVASFASLLAYTEHVFGLRPLGRRDAGAYDYANSFDYRRSPLPPMRLTSHAIPLASRGHVAKPGSVPDGT